MKHLFIILCTCSLLSGCSFSNSDYDYVISAVVDRTDPLHVEPSATEILSPTGLEKDMWQGVKVSVTDISDMDIATQRVFILPREIEILGNPDIRRGKVALFKKELNEYINAFHRLPGGVLNHSVIWRVLANQLNHLKKESATNKYALIYSDLMENSNVTFYSPATFALLTTNPKAIENTLEKECPLGSLKGMYVYCLYLPNNDKENTDFRASSSFFSNIFLAKGASSVTVCSALTQ